MTDSLSVVVRSKDEAPRLKLTLASLLAQSAPLQVVVVDDGSSDATPDVVAEAARDPRVKAIRHQQSLGRSVSSNWGAAAADGSVLLFLDGDTLAAPDLVQRHLDVHAALPEAIGRGETHHLRGVRFLHDPESGEPQPQHADRLARMSVAEKDALRITRAQIISDFASIDRRSSPGVYPGAGPAILYALEMEALRRHPECQVLWAGASGSNLSVPRALFMAAGGFDEALDRAPEASLLRQGAGLNEHRDLAYRLCRLGGVMKAVEGRTYHMTHRIGWRDPLEQTAWEDYFIAKHADPAFRLLSAFWGGISAKGGRSDAPRIDSLPALEAAAYGTAAGRADAAREPVAEAAL